MHQLGQKYCSYPAPIQLVKIYDVALKSEKECYRYNKMHVSYFPLITVIYFISGHNCLGSDSNIPKQTVIHLSRESAMNGGVKISENPLY